MNKKIFVAGPFNSHNEKIKDKRVETIGNYCVSLFNQNICAISALLLGLSFAKYGNLSTETNYWISYCEALMIGCDELHVLKLEGWEDSTGVRLEIECAERLGIPVVYIEI